MNANELADELESCRDYELPDYVHKTATMLRQQQAEIERLIGSKPITYGMLTFCKNCGEQNPYQSKTLTDEEIYKIAMEVQTGFFPQDDTLEFARAILRKASEK